MCCGASETGHASKLPVASISVATQPSFLQHWTQLQKRYKLVIYRSVSHNVVILSERSESKDLRTYYELCINAMRRFFDSAGAPLRMTYLGAHLLDKLKFEL